MQGLYPCFLFKSLSWALHEASSPFKVGAIFGNIPGGVGGEYRPAAIHPLQQRKYSLYPITAWLMMCTEFLRRCHRSEARRRCCVLPLSPVSLSYPISIVEAEACMFCRGVHAARAAWDLGFGAAAAAARTEIESAVLRLGVAGLLCIPHGHVVGASATWTRKIRQSQRHPRSLFLFFFVCIFLYYGRRSSRPQGPIADGPCCLLAVHYLTWPLFRARASFPLVGQTHAGSPCLRVFCSGYAGARFAVRNFNFYQIVRTDTG